MTCFVKHCKNVRRLLTPESKISFHRFPTDEETSRIWLHALDRQDDNFTWSHTKFICSDHFKPEDFETVAQKRMLKPTAIPALHLHQEEKNQGNNIVWASTSTSSLHSTRVCDKPVAFLEPMWSPTSPPREKRKHMVLSDESESESSPLPSPASSGVTIESSGSSSSASRKRKQIKLEHSYAASPSTGANRDSVECSGK